HRPLRAQTSVLGFLYQHMLLKLSEIMYLSLVLLWYQNGGGSAQLFLIGVFEYPQRLMVKITSAGFDK
ncbi:hypothetical protein L914_03008, partial [Phytophthora nicotianae]